MSSEIGRRFAPAFTFTVTGVWASAGHGSSTASPATARGRRIAPLYARVPRPEVTSDTRPAWPPNRAGSTNQRTEAALPGRRAMPHDAGVRQRGGAGSGDRREVVRVEAVRLEDQR